MVIKIKNRKFEEDLEYLLQELQDTEEFVEVQLMTKKIYNIIKNKLSSWVNSPGDLLDGNGYVYLEGDEIDESLINNSWVIAYDAHS